MNTKNILSQLNILTQCKKYGVPIWQCPQFIFLIMGIVTIGTAFASYLIGVHYVEDPQSVSLVVLGISSVLFVISFIINHSLERLAEANRMKSEFIGIVSHQLRAPLTNLKWTVELMVDAGFKDIKEGQMVSFTNVLRENSKRMEELINDLLIVSRIEKEGISNRKAKVNLVGLVEKLVSESAGFADASNIKLNFECQKGLPEVFLDPSQIKLVIENFIDNAIRYTKEGGVIEITLKEDNNNIYFEVKDQGVGIPEEDKKYIFQKFFRAKNVLKFQTQGSGLGLFIAKSVINKLGGKIGFKSEENKGSMFWFKLPLE